MSDGKAFYHGGRFFHISEARFQMVHHLHRDHGLTVRQINMRMNMTDKTVEAILAQT